MSDLPQVIATAMSDFNNIAQKEKTVVWAEESQFALQALQSNQMLAKCAQHTIQNAIVNVAAVGLTLNPADGYAYLVPEYNKQTKANECCLRISFKGLIKLATDTGSIKWVKAEIVREADKFEYNGPCQMPIHKMNPFMERGKVVGVYCVAKTFEGDYLVDVMDQTEVDKIRACAKTAYVWNQWPEEMAKKAIIKRAQKQWPKTQQSRRLHQAVEILNESEGSLTLEDTANYILEAIADEDYDSVREAWQELSEDEMSILWVAKSKGGYFTQQEKEFIRKAQTQPLEQEAV